MYYFSVALPYPRDVQITYCGLLIKCLHNFHCEKRTRDKDRWQGHEIAVAFNTIDLETSDALNHILFVSQNAETLDFFKRTSFDLLSTTLGLRNGESAIVEYESSRYAHFKRFQPKIGLSPSSAKLRRKIAFITNKVAASGERVNRLEIALDIHKRYGRPALEGHSNCPPSCLTLSMSSNKKKSAFYLNLFGQDTDTTSTDVSKLSSYGLNGIIPLPVDIQS